MLAIGRSGVTSVSSCACRLRSSPLAALTSRLRSSTRSQTMPELAVTGSVARVFVSTRNVRVFLGDQAEGVGARPLPGKPLPWSRASR